MAGGIGPHRPSPTAAGGLVTEHAYSDTRGPQPRGREADVFIIAAAGCLSSGPSPPRRDLTACPCITCRSVRQACLHRSLGGISQRGFSESLGERKRYQPRVDATWTSETVRYGRARHDGKGASPLCSRCTRAAGARSQKLQSRSSPAGSAFDSAQAGQDPASKCNCTGDEAIPAVFAARS